MQYEGRSRPNLRDALKDLLCSIIAHTDRAYPASLEQRVKSGPSPLPVGAHRFIFPPEKMHRLHLLSGGTYRYRAGDQSARTSPL